MRTARKAGDARFGVSRQPNPLGEYPAIEAVELLAWVLQYSRIAQLVEPRIENPWVAGSIPVPGTILECYRACSTLGPSVWFTEYYKCTQIYSAPIWFYRALWCGRRLAVQGWRLWPSHRGFESHRPPQSAFSPCRLHMVLGHLSFTQENRVRFPMGAPIYLTLSPASHRVLALRPKTRAYRHIDQT